MPINYSRYPSNWLTEIRPRILSREGHSCKFCGLKNGETVMRCTDGQWVKIETINAFVSAAIENDAADTSGRGGHMINVSNQFPGYPNELTSVRVVLTIAHLDHDEHNHDVKDSRLAALCQRCHLQYDAKEKALRRRVKKYSDSLFPFQRVNKAL